MEIESKGNFRTRSFEYGGGGVIVVERINNEYVRRNAHLSAIDPRENTKGFVFVASNGGFLTINGERIIVKTTL